MTYCRWESNSYGYHGDDGRKFYNSDKGEEYGPKFGTGDTIGACLHFGSQEIFYTKNGTKLKTAFRNVTQTSLYPTVGLHSKNEVVQINFGQSPFKYDLESFLIEEQDQRQAAVQRMQVAAGDAHQVVRSYLLHYGYGATLAAFDAAAGVEGIAHPMSNGGEDPVAATLATRQAVRQAIMSGQLTTATELLQQQCPAAVLGHTCSDEVQYQLSCQHYIELIREGCINDAMQFAQSVLAGLKTRATQRDMQLKDVVALIAYERPEESPLAHLLHLSQRELVADAVNAAVLQASGTSVGGSDGSSSNSMPFVMQSTLEVLLRQLVAAQGALREANGGMGEVFVLNNHLLPRPA
eukprot:GHRR01015113.1.p1 GENE.GHRR01015113.1~~GHRR01015113.1.p1  ORF type:complete len:351 (+),score=113.33 GHRR01015113.1:510-1562(+)